jgi:hypothetical protein
MPVTGILGINDAHPGNFSLGVSVYDAYARISQDILEILYVSENRHAFISQSVLEVLYKPDPFPALSKTVSHSVLIEPMIVPNIEDGGDPLSLQVYSNLLVQSEIGISTETSIRNVTSFLTVNQTVFGRTQEVARSVSHTVSVTQPWTFDQPNKFRAVTHTVNVSQTININFKDQSVSSLSVVSQTVFGKNDSIRQLVSHNVVVGSSSTNTTAERDMSLTSFVGVTQTIFARKDQIAQIVTTEVTAGLSIERRNTNIRLSVQQTVFVADHLIPANSSVRISVSSSATVATVQAPANSVVQHDIQHNITVSDIRRSNLVDESVTHTISVSSTLASRNTNVRIGVTSAVGVGVPTDEYNTGVQLPATNNVNISQLTDAQANPKRLWINHNSIVVSIPHAANDNPRRNIMDTVSVISQITGISPNDIIGSVISVSQTIELRNTNPLLSVSTNVTVGQLIKFHNTNTRLDVTSLIWIPQTLLPLPAQGFNSNNRQTVFHDVYVVSTLHGAGPIRDLSISHIVTVQQITRNNEIAQQLSSLVSVSAILSGGSSEREGDVSHLIACASTITPQTAFNLQTVTSSIFVFQLVQGQGPNVERRLRDEIYVDTVAEAEILPLRKLTSTVSVSHAIRDVGDPNRQSVTSNVIVVQPISQRNTNPRRTLTHTVNVNQRVQLLERELKPVITVTQKINWSRTMRLRETLVLDDGAIGTKAYDRTVIDTITFADQATRNITAIRNLQQKLFLPDSYYEKPITLRPGSLIIPVVVGVKMQKFVTIQSRNKSILLPAPEFDDSEANIASVDVKRSITGVTYTFVKSTGRRKLNWPFKLPLVKAIELKQFLIECMSEPVTILDWKGGQWYGVVTTNPFELSTGGRYSRQQEMIEIELEFEAYKIA